MKIREVWKISGLCIPMGIGMLLAYEAVALQNLFLAFSSLIFAWQAGWGVKLTYELDRIAKETEGIEIE